MASDATSPDAPPNGVALVTRRTPPRKTIFGSIDARRKGADENFPLRRKCSNFDAMSEPCSLAPIHVISGGLAGSEAAWQIARQNVPVVLHEMRPSRKTPAHQTGDLAELVCSNSFRADDPQTSAIGILDREMRCLNSLFLAAADAHKLPAGGALAVARGQFSGCVTETVCGHALMRRCGTDQ